MLNYCHSLSDQHSPTGITSNKSDGNAYRVSQERIEIFMRSYVSY